MKIIAPAKVGCDEPRAADISSAAFITGAHQCELECALNRTVSRDYFKISPGAAQTVRFSRANFSSAVGQCSVFCSKLVCVLVEKCEVFRPQIRGSSEHLDMQNRLSGQPL